MSMFSKWFSTKDSQSPTTAEPQKPRFSASDYCEQGQKSLDAGKYVEAMEYFQAAIEADKHFEKAYILLAESYVKQGNNVKAKSTLYGLLAIEPENEAALKKLGQLSQVVQHKDNSLDPSATQTQSTKTSSQTNSSALTTNRQNTSLNYRVVASVDSDVFDFFIVFDNGNRIYFKITNPPKPEVAVVSPIIQQWQSKDWDGYKKPVGKIEIPSSIEFGGDFFSVTAIEKRAFAKCGQINAVTIPQTIIAIKGESFYDCASLKTIALSSTIETIGASCFYGCPIERIDLPDSLISIGSRAFHKCEQLTSFRFPNCIETIHEYTLSGCRNLTTIIIPASVKEIKNNAFGDGPLYMDPGADSINLIMESMCPPKVGNSFIRNGLLHTIKVTVKVPTGALDAYMNAQYWQMLDIVEK